MRSVAVGVAEGRQQRQANGQANGSSSPSKFTLTKSAADGSKKAYAANTIISSQGQGSAQKVTVYNEQQLPVLAHRVDYEKKERVDRVREQLLSSSTSSAGSDKKDTEQAAI